MQTIPAALTMNLKEGSGYRSDQGMIWDESTPLDRTLDAAEHRTGSRGTEKALREHGFLALGGVGVVNSENCRIRAGQFTNFYGAAHNHRA